MTSPPSGESDAVLASAMANPLWDSPKPPTNIAICSQAAEG
ncbi:MAG: hypothetical protein WBG38_06640 [Nodosilinea sp.]